MPDKIFVTNIARGGSVSRTEIGQDPRGASYINRSIGKDLIVLKSAHDKWQGLKQRVRNELKIREISTGWFGRKKKEGLQLSVNIAHGSRRGVPRLRRVMQHYLDKYSASLHTLRKLERQPDGGDQKTKNAVIDDGYYYGRKLEHLKQFDAIAKGMFSSTYKASENLRGLSKKALGNVNPNLHDDMLLAQENKLLSINAHRRKDKSCGLVANRQSRRLIRQIVASALLHHGYATAKTLKQELTKACELAERSGTSNDASGYFEKRLSKIMEQINDGMLAADAVLEDIELRNVAALAEANLTERVADICSDVHNRPRVIEKTLFLVAARGSLNAARRFLELLKERNAPEKLDLALKTFDALQDANPKEPHYMYVPFNAESGGIDDAFKAGLEKYREKAHFTIIDRQNPAGLPEKPLGDIDPHHVVLIDGHGGNRQDEISAIRSKQVWENLSQAARNEAVLNADRLAERLEQDGLAKNHKVIRLLSCYAGGDTLYYDRDDQGGSGSLRPNLYDDAFAKRLAVALKKRGYRNIVVGGYPGKVGINVFKKTKYLTGRDDGSRKRLIASGLCRYFDGDGNVVPNPRNAKKAKMSSLEKDQMAANRLADGRLKHHKKEFEFPLPETRQTGPWIPTKDRYIRNLNFYKIQLNLKKPGHSYIADLTKKSFFADTNGIAHKTPLFSVQFRNYAQANYRTGVTVDAIIDIDSLRSMPLVDNKDNGEKAVKAFKEALIKLQKTLTDIGQADHMTELNNEIKNVIKSNDLNELKTFQAGRALGEVRNAVVGQVAEYFEGFHLLLLADPPADTDIPIVQVDTGDINVNEDTKVEEDPKI